MIFFWKTLRKLIWIDVDGKSDKNKCRTQKKNPAKKRRLKFLRLLVVMVIFGLIMTAVGWVCQQAYNWAYKTYAVYAEIYDDYRQRRELRAASFDPRFDGYTNILLWAWIPEPRVWDNRQTICFVKLSP